MSDLHSAIIWPQQSIRWRETAAHSNIIPEGFHHPSPSFKRELVNPGDRPAEDLGASSVFLKRGVFFLTMFIIFVWFCVTLLAIYLTTGDKKYNNYVSQDKIDFYEQLDSG